MKMIGLSGVILGLMYAPGAGAQKNDPCLDMQTQNALNVCEAEQYAKADAELNAVYRQLISTYKSDSEFVTKLRLAQASWLKFRDADLASLYYKKDKLAEYGSVYPMCKSMVLTNLTVERTKELKAMLNPEEGDTCAF
jgi:uncharacterized protein YecT (DUF1311 family)